MYLQYFQLQKSPFGMTPDPDFLFLTPGHREALAGLTYAILARKGFLVLTGDAGTGKTTLLARVLRYLPANRVSSSVILNPTLTPAEFLEMTLFGFGISDIPASKSQRLIQLHSLLLKAAAENRVCALVIDEAHKLSAEVLEEVRLLGNFEQSDQKLLQILLLGQNELAELLNRAELRQFKQRIATRFSIGPLSAAEVEQYLRYRWTKAGASNTLPFTPDAIDRVAWYSKGIPRVINAICDNALLLAFGETKTIVTAGHVQQACIDLDLVTAAPVSAPEPVNSQPSVVSPAPVLNSFERYKTTNQSRLARWAGKLRLA